MTEADAAVDRLVGEEIVLDMASPYVIVGVLAGCDARYFLVDGADVHDLRDTTTTRELYVRDAKRHGISANRRSVLVRREEVVALSRLGDVIE